VEQYYFGRTELAEMEPKCKPYLFCSLIILLIMHRVITCSSPIWVTHELSFAPGTARTV
jgi:hypothetical protein